MSRIRSETNTLCQLWRLRQALQTDALTSMRCGRLPSGSATQPQQTTPEGQKWKFMFADFLCGPIKCVHDSPSLLSSLFNSLNILTLTAQFLPLLTRPYIHTTTTMQHNRNVSNSTSSTFGSIPIAYAAAATPSPSYETLHGQVNGLVGQGATPQAFASVKQHIFSMPEAIKDDAAKKRWVLLVQD